MKTTDVINSVSFSGSRPKPPHQARSLIKSLAHRITCTYSLIVVCRSTRKPTSMPLFVNFLSLLRAGFFFEDFTVLALRPKKKCPVLLDKKQSWKCPFVHTTNKVTISWYCCFMLGRCRRNKDEKYNAYSQRYESVTFDYFVTFSTGGGKGTS